MEGESSQPVWTPPKYDISRPPEMKREGSLLASKFQNNFARWAKWCPDGSAALAQCEDASFQYLDLPSDVTGLSADVPAGRLRTLPQPAPILDFAWYPFATSRDPAAFCFVASVRETPVKLLDAADGRLRASYKIVDHRERHIAPHSLAFNQTATKLYCGFEDAIEVFDVHVPGEGTRLHTTPTKKSRDGLKGIVSALAFSPDTTSGVYAAGTLSPSAPSSSNIALFSEATGEVPAMFLGDERPGRYGVRASVNQLRFNPMRPYLLYASFRRHDTIYSWDVRGDVTKPIQTFVQTGSGHSGDGRTAKQRRQATNQRLRFDVDIAGNWLGVGDFDGEVSLFDLTSVSEEVVPGIGSEAASARTEPRLRFQAHNDAVGSVGFHPYKPLLLSVSGSRHYVEGGDSDSEESSEDESGSDDEVSTDVQINVRRPRERPSPSVRDASFKIWDFTGSRGGDTHAPPNVLT
ncbi:WD40 repeat domain-containing protein [Phanerochaete sordida]|uniref:WD40 repeat domain-containing protein n=1 Tax=Phanerochaete sordida TaxID=48140 RepID=A0A9P3GND3_9APHY|nr:WD40 repeat domain-containing protein [Phanerochaete sordida]